MTDDEAAAFVARALARPYARDLFGIELVSVAPGAVTLALPHRVQFEHAPGLFQGTITSALAELAASYSAATASDPAFDHMTVQQSIHFLGAARGCRLVAEGRVVRSGRSTSVSMADVFAEDGGRRHCAMMTMTMRHRASR